MMRTAFAFAAIFLRQAHASCGNANDCSSCLSDPSCYWWPDIGYCEQGCGMDGCGASMCASDITTCSDCLGDGGSQPSAGLYAWSPSSGENGMCVESCMDPNVPADASCLPGKNPFNGFQGYTEADCPEVEPSDCESCLSSGSNMFWWPDIEFCEEGCGMNGCGASMCASEITNCWDCLGDGSGGQPSAGMYAWSPSSGEQGECVESCSDPNVPADASCYPGKNIYNNFEGYTSSTCDDLYGPPLSKCESIGTNCNKCLKDDCAWDGMECYDDCDSVPADGSCWQGKNAKQTRSSICSRDTVAFA